MTNDPDDTTPIEARPEATPVPASTDSARRSSGSRPWLIAAGVAAVALAGTALGFALASTNDDEPNRYTNSSQSSEGNTSSGTTGGNTADQSGESSNESGSNGSTTTDANAIGVTTADEFMEILEAAQTISDLTPMSIETEGRGYWEVEFEDQQGTEVTVRVDSDLNATLVEEDRDDDSEPEPAGSLTRDNIDSALSAAFAQTEGTAVEISVDDDSISDAYEVHVLSPDGTTITEIELDTDFNVSKVEVDSAFD